MSISPVAASSIAMQQGGGILLYSEEYRTFFWPVLVLVLPLMPLLWKYHVRITDDELSFGYSSRFTSKLVRNRLAVIEEATPLFDRKWLGWGIHYQPDASNIFGRWERLYIANNGGAVKVVVRDDVKKGTNGGDAKATTFYFSTNDPQKVSDILNQNTLLDTKALDR